MELADRTRAPRRRGGAGALAAVALAVLATAAPAQAPAARGSDPERSFFGVTTSPAFMTNRDVAGMRRGGVGTARLAFDWREFQTGVGFPYDWRWADGQMKSLARHHVRALPVFYATPGWLAADPYAPAFDNPDWWKGWTSFLSAAASRYGPHGTFWKRYPQIPYYPILAWQIWNEPNHYFGAKPSPKAYAHVLQVSAKAIRAAQPKAKIVLAGLGPGLGLPTQMPYYKFLRALYRIGAQRWFDVVADHPYAPDVRDAMREVRTVAKIMRRNHDRKTPLWITELGWGSIKVRDKPLTVGPKRQARFLRRSFRFIIAHRRAFHVTRLYWYNWRDAGRSGACDTCLAFGLHRPNLAPKPSWRAYKSFARP